MRSIIAILVLFALGTAATGQDRHDWQSLAQLRAGEKIRLVIKTGSIEPHLRVGLHRT